MMLGRRPEIPQGLVRRFAEGSEAIRFVLCPCADMCRGQVADIVHIETEERAHLGLLENIFGAGKAFPAQAIEVDAILPIDFH